MASTPSSSGSLPPGTYILNNGPKKKGQGGRFTMGTHSALKQLMKDVPGITFTDKPEKADFVIVPEGVREPGHKLMRRNPALKDPRNVFSMDQIAHVMRSSSYRHRSSRTKHGLMYTTKDAKGRDVQIDIPTNLEPSDQAFMQTISKIASAELIRIPDKDYTVIRRNLRGPPAPVIVPGPPAANTPVVSPGSRPPMETVIAQAFQDKSSQIAQKIAQLDSALGSLQQMAPPMEPVLQQFQPPQQQQQSLPMMPVMQPPQQQQQQPAPIGDDVKSQWNTLRTDTKDAIGFLKSTAIYDMKDPDNAFVTKSEPNDDSRDIVVFLHTMDNLRYNLEVLLYAFANSDQDQQDSARRKEIAYRSSDQSIRSVKDGVRRVSSGMPYIERVLESLENLVAAIQTDSSTLKSAVIEMICNISKTEQVAQIKNASYRTHVLQAMRSSRVGMTCKKENAICHEEKQPERVENILYALFNAACEIVNTVKSSPSSNPVEYRAICKNLENVSATICDIYNFLHVAGFNRSSSADDFMKCGDGGQVCENMYTAMYDCLKAYSAVIPKESVQNIPMIIGRLQKLALTQNDSKESNMWRTTENRPSLYNLFFRFLTRTDPETDKTDSHSSNRTSTFATMQSQLNDITFDPSRSADKERQKFYAYMSVTALFFVFANFCSGSKDGILWSGSGTGNFTVEEIKSILKDKQFSEQPEDAQLGENESEASDDENEENEYED